MFENPNVAAAFIAVSGSLVTTLLVLFVTHWQKTGLSASEQEVQSRAAYVQLLQTRVSELETNLRSASERENQLSQRIRLDGYNLDRRWRHLANALVQYALILKLRLARLSTEDIPPFTGWDRFLEEGGELHDEWEPDQKRII